MLSYLFSYDNNGMTCVYLNTSNDKSTRNSDTDERVAFAPLTPKQENVAEIIRHRNRKHPLMKIFIAIASLVVAALILPFFFTPDGADMSRRMEQLPWNVEARPDGNSTVMGLVLNQSTLEAARVAFGPDMEVAIVAAPGEEGSIEAYVGVAKAGFVTGKMVFVADAQPDMVKAMQSRAAKVEYMESTTRKSTPTSADLATIMNLSIKSIVFIPSVNLDRNAVVERFGTPASEVPVNAQQTHLLYPEKGLDILLDAKAKEVFQYVAPKEFARLSDPLLDTKHSDSSQ